MSEDSKEHLHFSEKKVTLDGVEKTVEEWATEKGLKVQTVYDRRRKGDTWAQAFRPIRKTTHANSGFAKSHYAGLGEAVRSKKQKSQAQKNEKQDAGVPTDETRPKRSRFA